jgi:hypothetical protein
VIAVTQTATRYDLSFPDFDPKARETWAAIRDVKAIPGRMFDAGAKVWRIPLSASVEIRALAEKYGAQIEELAIEGGYSVEAAHRIAQLEAQLAATVTDDDSEPTEVAALKEDVTRLTDALRREKDRQATVSTSVLSIEDMIAAVKAAGYSVTRRKAATRQGHKPTSCIHCGSAEGLHVAILDGGKGRRTAAYRRMVGVCHPCYRFGPMMRGVPMVPEDQVRYARLYSVWRKAHHRYARRYAARHPQTRQADNLAENIKKAMQGIRNVPNPAIQSA